MNAYMDQGLPYLDPAPILPARHVEDCSLKEDRNAIIALMKKDAVVAEVGVDRGEFSKRILDTCKPSKLHLFDIDLARLDVSNVHVAMQNGVCKLHGGDSSSLLNEFDDAYFDWIYIDGDHRYEGVCKDIAVAARKVKADGRLIFNDYTVWSPQSMMHCGVARAVNEFCIAENWGLEYLCFQSLMYNDVALKKI